MKKIKLHLLLLILFSFGLAKISFATEEFVCEAVKALGRLTEQYKSYSGLLSEPINKFVRTGNYSGKEGHFSGLNYNRVAKGAERRIIFEALIETSLPKSHAFYSDAERDEELLKNYRSSLLKLHENRGGNRHYHQDYAHQLMAYITAELTTNLYNSPATNWNDLEESVVFSVAGLPCTQFNGEDYIRSVIRSVYNDPCFKKAWQNVEKRHTLRLQIADPLPPSAEAWAQEAKAGVRLGRTRSLEKEQLNGANSITVVFSERGKGLARVGGVRPYEKFAWDFSKRLGLTEHLAPSVRYYDATNKYERRVLEQFVRLFDDPSQENAVSGDIADFLKSARNTNGDLCLLRAVKKSEKKYEEALNAVCPDSMDLLFLHHILLSAPDSCTRNFLFQYRNGQLHLVRIDYGERFGNTAYFLGEGTKAAALEPFGSKGKQIIGNLSVVLSDEEFWSGFAMGYGFDNPDSVKNRFRTRLRILNLIHQKDFFEQGTRSEVIFLLYYISLRMTQEDIQQDDFLDTYIQGMNAAFWLTSDVKWGYLAKIFQAIESELLYSRSRGRKLKPIDDSFISQAVENWMTTKNKLMLSGVKEHLAKAKKYVLPKAFLLWGIDPNTLPDLPLEL